MPGPTMCVDSSTRVTTAATMTKVAMPTTVEAEAAVKTTMSTIETESTTLHEDRDASGSTESSSAIGPSQTDTSTIPPDTPLSKTTPIAKAGSTTAPVKDDDKRMESGAIATVLPRITPYEPKISSHCTIHRPSLSELQSFTFSDYIRQVILPAASVRYETVPTTRGGGGGAVTASGTASTTRATNDHSNHHGGYYDSSKSQPLANPMQLREGLAKITLPAQFQRKPIIEDTTGRGEQWGAGTVLGDFVISSPIQQNLRGMAGVYEYTFTEQSPLRMTEFRDKADAYRKQQVGVGVEESLSADRIQQLERLFWKRLGPTMSPAWYGADQEGSFFHPEDGACGWSLGQLDSCLHALCDGVPGVTTSYLYAGMWGASFAAHTEDVHLLSINYLHAGAPKFWYAIAEPDSQRFLNLCQFHFALQYAECPEFLRHKRYLISPQVLQRAGIRYQTAIQYPGDAIVTFPASIHFGFNLGFNFAEATNFAVPEWIPFGRTAKVCLCRPYSVRIDVDKMANLLDKYERDHKHARRGKRLSWGEWGRQRRQRQAENRKKRFVMEQLVQGSNGSSSSKKSRLQGKPSEQQRKNEFWVEVTSPVTKNQCGGFSERTEDSSKRGSKRTSGGAQRKKKLIKKQEQGEIWHLAKPITRVKLAQISARVLCMMPVLAVSQNSLSKQKMKRSRLQTQYMEDSESDSDRDELDDEDEEEKCFSGQIVDISDDFVRVHLDGLPKSDDVWFHWSNPKLFLDGGRWNEEHEENGIPALHYWQEMDSSLRCDDDTHSEG